MGNGGPIFGGMEHFLEIFSKHLDRFDVEAERSTQS